MKRETCEHCHYPKSICLCHAITTIKSPVQILVIQHYKETTHAKNTVRLAKLTIPSIKVLTVKNDSDIASVLDFLRSFNYAVFFPSTNSKRLKSSGHDFKQCNYDLLVFIDGTWKQSKGIFRKIETQNMECWHLNPEYETQYKIRQSKQNGGFSTLEAMALALNIAFDLDSKPMFRLLDVYQSQWQNFACKLGNKKPGRTGFF